MKPRIQQLHRSGALDGEVPVWDNSLGYWVPGAPSTSGLAGVVIEYAHVDDTDGHLVYRWGINATGQPVFDPAGVTAGTEAALCRDATSGDYYVEAITA